MFMQTFCATNLKQHPSLASSFNTVFFAKILTMQSFLGREKTKAKVRQVRKKVLKKLKSKNSTRRLMRLFPSSNFKNTTDTDSFDCFCDQVFQTSYKSANYGQEFKGCGYLAPGGCFQALSFIFKNEPSLDEKKQDMQRLTPTNQKHIHGAGDNCQPWQHLYSLDQARDKAGAPI